MKNYYIKTGYRARVLGNVTLDVNRKDEYWSSKRVRNSASYQWGIYKYAASLIAHKDNAKVLDIGCGSGFKLYHIIGKCTDNIIGLDQQSAINYCRSHYNKGQWLVQNVEESDFQTDNLDIIISADVIEHLVSPESLLRLIKRNATANTDIVISTPERDRLRGAECMISPKAEHIREWNMRELSNYLFANGFTIVKHFLQVPMRLSIYSWKSYLNELWRQRKMGMHFRYNQVVHCRLSS